jgi:endonuclease/exonuclease/phosphatase family metal-dependent hydrolase
MKFIKFTYILILPVFLSSCALLSGFSRNYTNPTKPRYAEINNITQHTLNNNTIKIVSYNIKESKKIHEAIYLLKENNLSDVDVICLQEMDLGGVKTIADELKYNYVYYPASVEDDKDFGNAILTKWKIVNDNKIILPHLSPNLKQRIAVTATLEVGNKKLLVFSIHLGVNISPLQRGDQIDKIIQAANPNINHVVIAGDFNTFTKSNLRAMIDPLKEEGFKLVSKDLGWTYKHWYLFNKKTSLDHIIARDLNVLDTGKILDRSASDHIPIWAHLEFK